MEEWNKALVNAKLIRNAQNAEDRILGVVPIGQQVQIKAGYRANAAALMS